jgi:hypothetical protein
LTIPGRGGAGAGPADGDEALSIAEAGAKLMVLIFSSFNVTLPPCLEKNGPRE